MTIVHSLKRFCILAALIFAFTGCWGPVMQPHTPAQVEVVTAVSEASGPVGKRLAAAYEDGALTIIADSDSVETALLTLAVYDMRWKNVWGAWDVVRYEQDNCLIDTKLCDESSLAAAWCDLIIIAGTVSVEVPDVVDCRGY